MPTPGSPASVIHEIAVVVPVYQGEHALDSLAEEIAPLTEACVTPGGRQFRVSALILVHDGARDESARVMKQLAGRYSFVEPIWLSRNFGQHSATLAGIAASHAPWIATIDEDGQQNPQDIARFLDSALDHGARLVYARATNQPPHGFLRNRMSRLAKWLFVRVLGSSLGEFNSFRLIEGEVGRAVASHCGANVYLDVALSWGVDDALHCPVTLREERGRRTGYTLPKLLRHFWGLVLTSGTAPLRLVALLGAMSILFGVVISGVQIWRRLQHQIPVQGWTSTIVAICFFSGLILISLGIIAEYLGVAVSMAMGKPTYIRVSRPVEDLGDTGDAATTGQ